MKITELENEEEMIQRQAAELLISIRLERSPDFRPNLQDSMEAVKESFGPGRISLAVLDGQRLAAWVGARRQSNWYAWELYPLLVNRTYRLRGLGKKLVTTAQQRVLEHGAITLWVTVDDELGATSLWGQDLYPDPLTELQNICNLNHHPYEFFEKLGFVRVGVLPDANGLGKPNIVLAKRVREIS